MIIDNENPTWEEESEKFFKPFKDIYYCACKAHNWFKPGLHEDAYEVGLKIELEQIGYLVEQQK